MTSSNQPVDATPTSQIDLKAAEEAYRERVVGAYNRLPFDAFEYASFRVSPVPFHLEDISLAQIFVRLTTIKEATEVMHGHEVSREREQKHKAANKKPIELAQALCSNLLIKGEPGASKTTLLQWLAVTFARGRQQEADRLGPSAAPDYLPVLVKLGDLSQRKSFPWFDILPEYQQGEFGGNSGKVVKQALDAGRCLLLYDGLDEIPDPSVRVSIANSLEKLASTGNRIVIGSRLVGVSKSEKVLVRAGFRICEIEPFAPDDVQRFFQFWYSQDQRLFPKDRVSQAEELFNAARDSSDTLQLATNPLFSSILALIWQEEHKLSKRRVELYEDCCKILINRWKGSYTLDNDDTLRREEWEERHLGALALIAHVLHSHRTKQPNEHQNNQGNGNGTDDIHSHSLKQSNEQAPLLKQKLVDELVKHLQAESLRADETTARRYLEELAEHSGLLHQDSGGSYSFPHQTFQEYLAARHIAAQPDPDYIDLVMKHLHEKWWQQVHLMTIGRLSFGKEEDKKKASELIRHILKVYKPPSRLLRPKHNRWMRLIEPGRYLPGVQLERRVAWVLAREYELAIKAYIECEPTIITINVTVTKKLFKNCIAVVV